jgi:hypothetical protein
MSNPAELSAVVKQHLRQHSTKWLAYDGAVYDRFLSSIKSLEVESASTGEFSADALPDLSSQPSRMVLVDEGHIDVVFPKEDGLDFYVLQNLSGMWDVVPLCVAVKYSGQVVYSPMFPTLAEAKRVQSSLNSIQPIIGEWAEQALPYINVGIATMVERSGSMVRASVEKTKKRKSRKRK